MARPPATPGGRPPPALTWTVDLNADVGELPGSETALLGLVTSAHVACGYHAGDVASMRRAVAASLAAGTVVGAHPSYPDRAGFGRVPLDRPPRLVADDVRTQVAALQQVAAELGTVVRSVKPHGALYHRMGTDRACARAVADAVASCGPDLVLVVPAGPPGALAAGAALAAGVRPVTEAFCDRRYRPDGTLVARREPGAVIDDPGEAAEQAVSLVTAGLALAPDGTEVALRCETLCLHGDTPGALKVAVAVRHALEAAGVVVAPRAGP